MAKTIKKQLLFVEEKTIYILENQKPSDRIYNLNYLLVGNG